MCHLDLQPALPPGPKDFPDEFFEVTVDDVRKRLSQLQSERQVPFPRAVPVLVSHLTLTEESTWLCR